MLYLHRYITPNVPISETGTATLGIRVARTFRRKRKTTRITNAMEMARVRSTSLTEARMVVVRSSTMVKSIAAGTEAFKDGMASRMRSTVSIILAPGWRKIIKSTQGLPFMNPVARMFSTSSRTSAMSESFTAAPLW